MITMIISLTYLFLINRYSNSCIYSYLTKKTESLKVNSSNNEWEEHISGVPQGSSMRAVLIQYIFIFMTNLLKHMFSILVWVGRFLANGFQAFLSLARSLLSFLLSDLFGLPHSVLYGQASTNLEGSITVRGSCHFQSF